jgi:alpha-2-macroglobulin
MRIKTFLVPILFGTIFLSACKRNAVLLSFTNAKGEVPQLSNLVFRFSHSLVKDSMLNAWDSTNYISFDPAIKGKFRWQSPDELVFSPSQPLDPATTYKAKIKNAVLKYSEYDAVKNADKISFHTPPLTLDNSQVIWIGDNSSSATPQLDLVFNYRIDPADLKNKLEVEIDGKKASYTMLTASPGNKISLRLNGVKLEDRDLETKINISKGLRPENGKNATEDPISSSMTIPSPFTLTVQNMETEHNGTDGVVKLSTSQQIPADNLRQYIKFEPDVSFTVEPDENGFTVRSDKFDLEKSYAISKLQGLRGNKAAVLKE